MSKNRIGRYFHIPKRVMLGTNIVPIGRLRVLREEEKQLAINNYKAKKEELRKNHASKEEMNKVKLVPVELRLDFIPFERSRRKAGEKPIEHFTRDYEDHHDLVDKSGKALLKKYNKKYSGEIAELEVVYRTVSKATSSKVKNPKLR